MTRRAGAAARPLAAYAVAFVAGTWFGLGADLPAGTSLLLALVSGALLLLSLFPGRSRRRAARAAGCAARVSLSFVLALGLGGFRDGSSDDALAALLAAAGGGDPSVRVVGEITSVGPPAPASFGERKYRFRLAGASVRPVSGGFPAGPLPDSLAVVWYGDAPGGRGPFPEKGAKWELKGKARLRRGAGKDGGKPDMRSVFLVSRRSSTRVLAAPCGAGLLGRLRARGAAALSQGLDGRPAERSLVLAMTLGLRGGLPRELTSTFRRAGTIHVFAISGLHVVAVAGIVAFVLGSLGVPRHRWFCFLAPFITAYVLLAGAPASAARAGLMACLYYLAPLLGRKPDPLNTLSATVVALLLASPTQLRDLGFVLSFSMVLGLILCAGPSVRLCRALFRTEALAGEAALAEAAGGAAARPLRLAWRMASFAADALGVSVAAALVSLPLTAYHFGMLVPFSILANVVVVPLSGVVMLFAAAGLLAACAYMPLATPFNLLAASGAGLMEAVSRRVASLPGASPEIVFPLWALVAWYAALACLAAILRRAARRRDARDAAPLPGP